jgi:hypothetical protein
MELQRTVEAMQDRLERMQAEANRLRAAPRPEGRLGGR